MLFQYLNITVIKNTILKYFEIFFDKSYNNDIKIKREFKKK